jgi:RHS repeat-associated protein
VKKANGQWIVHQRYVVGGLDDVVAGRYSVGAGSSGPVNLALVADRQGSTLHAVKEDGTRESNAALFGRNPFGMEIGASGTGGDVSAGTGFAGASTPNATGGFTYLRNRWYDPKTGRFLTQDPIGLAGGVNLYSYAGNDPASFGDPFGLTCIPPDSPRCQIMLGLSVLAADAVSSVANKLKTPEGRGELHNTVMLATGIAMAVQSAMSAVDDVPVSGGASVADDAVPIGTRLFRAAGGSAPLMHQGRPISFTTVNPMSVSNFRSAAGLYPGNAGTVLLEGVLTNARGVTLTRATAGPAGPGGISEVIVPNAAEQVRVTRISTVRPPF